MKILSPKQRKIFDFVRHFGAERGYPPTVRDIVIGCQLSSTSVADYNLDILQREGYIRRHTGVSRGIELLTRSPIPGHNVQLPVIGQISAGEPIPVPLPDTWDVTATSDTIEQVLLPAGHIGVFMGSDIIKNYWPGILKRISSETIG